jgi:hypothetical protein
VKRERKIAGVMAANYVATSAWLLVHVPSFQAVTGPKKERWLVRMVGTLAVANALALAVCARKARLSSESRALAIPRAAAFATVDVVSVVDGPDHPVYPRRCHDRGGARHPATAGGGGRLALIEVGTCLHQPA